MVGDFISFNKYLKQKYKGRVQKISIDAGFTCPNRDGTKSVGGCTYCSNVSFSPFVKKNRSIKEQIELSIQFYKKRYKNIKGFIAYFQAYTNTYSSVENLREIYDTVLEYDEIIGMSIGTRPDSVPEEVLDLISSYTFFKPEIWIEYGLETANVNTLRAINRAHGVSDFVDAVLRTKRRGGLKVCTHIIVGLPNETKEDYIETVKLISALNVDGIKIHPLHIVKHTVMEKQYYRGEIQLLTMEEYADIVAELLEYLPKDIIIQRLTGEALEDELIAPDWCTSKRKKDVLNMIEKAVERNNKCKS